MRTLLAQIDPTLWCDVQDDHEGRPIGIMIASRFDTAVIPLRLTGRAVIIGDETIALGAPRAGDAISWAIASRTAAMVKAPHRVSAV